MLRIRETHCVNRPVRPSYPATYAGLSPWVWWLMILPVLALPWMAAEDEKIVRMIEDAPAAWPRPGVAVPELPAVPALDGVREAVVWDKAAPLAMRYTIDSAKPFEKTDTRVWAGHRDGTLYLLVEQDWDRATPPKITTKERDGEIWRDDSIEVFLAAAGALEQPVQLSFNWNGVQGDSAITWDPVAERVLKSVTTWNPAWQVQCARNEKRLCAEVALPLKELLGAAGSRGEVLRLDIVRNCASAVPPELHWAAVEGPANCRPEYFGVAVLAGGDGARLKWPALQVQAGNDLVYPDRRVIPQALRGQAVTFAVLNPLQGWIEGSPFEHFTYSLTGPDGKVIVAAEETAKDVATLTFSFQSTSAAEGRYVFQLRGAGPRAFEHRFAFDWQDCIVVTAATPGVGTITGRSRALVYPRTVGQQILALSKDAQFSFTARARSFALCLPPAFSIPGPSYGTPLLQTLRCRVDNGEWLTITVAGSPREVILADGLPEGLHTVTVEGVDGDAWLEGFRIARGRISRVHGFLHASSHDELLVDVRADVIRDGRIVRTEYVRAPHNGSVDLLGLAPGSYTVRFTAAGWESLDRPVKIDQPGGVVDLGLCVINRQDRLNGWRGDLRPRFGQSISLTPGAIFSAVVPVWKNPPLKAFLVSRFRTVELVMAEPQALEFGRQNPLVQIAFTVPQDTPHDLYDLRLRYSLRNNASDDTIAQSICVRETLPERFFLAGCGHMNVWGQETSEYLARVGAMAELAGARSLLVANEVNPAYVSGALGDLRIPYVTCSGNHTVGRWAEFYGAQPTASSDGALRIVSFGQFPYESWSDAERLLQNPPGATARVLVCYEGFAPIDTIRNSAVDLLFDGHSESEHPRAAELPAGTLKLRANSQDSLRWIPLSPQGLAADKDAEIPTLLIPRDQPSPLRVEFHGLNDGTAKELSATVMNHFEIAFEHARLRLVLAAGKYNVTGGQVLQAFNSDDQRFTVLDVEVAVKAKSETPVAAQPVP